MTDSCVGEANRDEARNKTSDPLIGFNFDKILHPDAIVHVLQTLWPHGAIIIDKSLQGVG